LLVDLGGRKQSSESSSIEVALESAAVGHEVPVTDTVKVPIEA
jgi:hypothetical protein